MKRYRLLLQDADTFAFSETIVNSIEEAQAAVVKLAERIEDAKCREAVK